MKRRILAMFLCIVMIFSLTVSAYAEKGGQIATPSNAEVYTPSNVSVNTPSNSTGNSSGNDDISGNEPVSTIAVETPSNATIVQVENGDVGKIGGIENGDTVYAKPDVDGLEYTIWALADSAVYEITVVEHFTVDGVEWYKYTSDDSYAAFQYIFPYVLAEDVELAPEEISDTVTVAGIETSVLVEGNLPLGAELEVQGTDIDITDYSIDNEDKVIAALDIKILDGEGNEWQPADGETINVALDAESLGLSDGFAYGVMHEHDGNVSSLGEYVVEAGKVTFTTDGFSVFVVTGLWGVADNTYGQTITMYIGDTLYFKCDTAHGNNGNTQNHSWTILGNVVSIAGTYTYPDGSDSGRDYSYVAITANGIGNATLHCTDNSNGVTINVVSKPESGTLSVNDNIYTNGCLIPNYTGTFEVASYKWYRNDNLDGTGEYEEVSGESISSTYASNNGVNVAVDQGGKCWYYVEAYDADGNLIVKSESYWVPYSNELENGDFENPVITGYNPFDTWGAGNVQFNQEDNRYITTAKNVINGTALWWRTTGLGSTNGADGRDIEIVRPANASLNGVYYVTPAEGNQYAELNCEAIGTLYQDVLTAPNTTLKWSFSHLGREGTDTMAVVVMPANVADEWAAKLVGQTTADGINNVLTQIDALDGATVWYDLEASEEGDDTTPTWTVDSGEYKTVEGQYLSRFFFVSVDSASNSLTMGNFIDGVSFDDKLTYTINYYLDGVLQSTDSETGEVKPFTTVSASHTADYSSYALQAVIKAVNGTENTEWGSTSMKVSQNDTTLALYYVTTGISVTKQVQLLDPDGNMTSDEFTKAQETIWENFGSAEFSLQDSGGNVVASAVVSVNAETGEGVALFYDDDNSKYVPKSGASYTIVETSTHEVAGYIWSKSGDVQVTIGVDAKSASVVYTNSYEVGFTNLTIVKNVIESTIDQDFMFQIKGTDNGIDMTVVIHADEFSNGSASVTINNLPVGDYTVAELTEWSWRYQLTSATAANDSSAVADITNSKLTFCLANAGETVTFTNSRTKDGWVDNSAWLKNIFNSIINVEGTGTVNGNEVNK